MHSIKEIDMLVAKMDLLAKRVKHYENVSAQETLKAMVSISIFMIIECREEFL
jgi:hypothetical protein